MENEGLTYKKAGVDIDAANYSVDLIKKWVGRTKRPEVLADIGSFGGFFALNNQKYREPVLVSGTDGVGTKLRIAQMMGIHHTVGIDLVAMCVNDILVHGAEPLFFLDYIAIGKLQPELVEALVQGVSEGCVQAGCALIGGETAEMPGFYKEDEYDLAGFTVGVVDKGKLINGDAIEEGDVLIGLPSSGIHSNGYSLARQALLGEAGLKLDDQLDELEKSLGEELLTPTRIYVPSVLALLEETNVKGMAHITGGGIAENLQRSIPPGLGAEIDSAAINTPAIFKLIQARGRVPREEMFKTFNMGIGFIIALAPQQLDKALNCLRVKGEKPIMIGKITAQSAEVVIR
ncbi:Phosphoribosylformylglycinamidine cyclo-ligase [Syntrophomonas zehnderi OL-4]|uniref:Phosphoribosylformylglycinamidine cyclo-ligase n=1 Tax=Syntrophomonas zehnderi OL-4 TaxID=690567 RepID=A0A0E4GDA6_9FIRM|nr:phosphoribosylformylglycinamidine cyclo-ligase [Syntrophomonas zehnderi]CFY03337.1 Phosphoribosylformylglycinamidine cyclo-ligase [Syntrophomonas zehnderi OL-4]